MKYKTKAKDIIECETQLRRANEHENEIATMFDMLMWYMKAWKYQCQLEFNRLKPAQDKPCFESTYTFFSEVEAIVYDYTKSMLIDCETLNYRSSVLMASVISASIEVYLNLNLPNNNIN
jgi:hypothetical protein